LVKEIVANTRLAQEPDYDSCSEANRDYVKRIIENKTILDRTNKQFKAEINLDLVRFWCIFTPQHK
jgi:hypothetical protein